MSTQAEVSRGIATTRDAEPLRLRCVVAEERFANASHTPTPPARPAVVVVGSSRGGTSFLFDLLASTRAFRTITGEHTPLYRTFGVLPLDSPPSEGDAVVTSGADEEGLRMALWRHSQPIGADNKTSTDALRIAVLLERQWGALGHPASFWLTVAGAIARLAGDRAVEKGVLRILQSVPGVDIRYYDACMDPGLAEPGMPEGPPLPLSPSVESPPFVVPLPAETLPNLQGDPARPLLLKASVDAYRLGWLCGLLGDIKVVHLVRNPAASVNGLIDGWRSPGYFSYLLAAGDPLAIEGYSQESWSEAWWNFDLPPGWRGFRAAALADVCAMQWTEAHSSIIKALAANDLPYFRLRAEELMKPSTLHELISRIMDFCGIANFIPPVPRVVMSTAPPRPYRWLARRGMVTDAVCRDSVLDVAETLGYGRSVANSWS